MPFEARFIRVINQGGPHEPPFEYGGMRMARVAIRGCEDYEYGAVKEALGGALAAIGGLEQIKDGSKVIIKANLVSMAKPDDAVTTHPALLCALVELLKEKHCTVIIGDSPGGLYNAAHLDRVYSATGMKDAVAKGAELNRDFSHAETRFDGAAVAKVFEYTSYLDGADHIINFCKLKTHGMMAMSCAVKNMFGVVPGVFKPEYHYKYPNYEDFANMLIDLNEYFKPSLCIVDAVVGMEGNGPTMGEPRRIGALLASRDPYALDVCCAHLIGLKSEDVPTVVESHRRGLTPMNVSEIDVDGDVERFVVPDYKILPTKSSLQFGKGSNKFLNFISPIADRCLRSRPILKEDVCIGCGKCASICPAKAITMKSSKANQKGLAPRIKKSVCISCFCCQEFCPVGALKVHRPIIARIINRTSRAKKSKE